MSIEHHDVIIVGAGLSGIGAAWFLSRHCPDRDFVMLEGRADIGGTWDLFRYPGVRSDSDMHTLGYSFKPWTEADAIADGPSIMRYLRETVAENGFESRIRFRHHVRAARWSSRDARWTIDIDRGDAGTTLMSCSFLYMCSGYYDYAQGHTPHFQGREDFRGRIVHPQFWDESLDCTGKRVVIIGSGATAVTLLPELAKDAAHVTMLQRTPTYMASRPREDRWANRLRRWLPESVAYGITRWRNVGMGMYFYNLTRRQPQRVRDYLIGQVRKALGPGHDVDTHFTPPYAPWDQRLCLVPDGDLFEALRAGRASVVTDTIDRFTADGIRLASGQTLAADVIVTATGLELLALGGVRFTVDNEPVEVPQTLAYKGMMLSDVPNLACAFGYTNASWTLKADLTSTHVCRLLNHMRRHGFTRVCPRRIEGDVEELPWLDLTSGYVQRGNALFPKQGNKAPWRLHQNYFRDLVALRISSILSPALEFSTPDRQEVAMDRSVA